MRRIGLFGYGKSTAALIDYFATQPSAIPYTLTVRSETAVDRAIIPHGVALRLGKDAFLPPFEDILYLSPSVRYDRAELLPMRAAGVTFSSEVELFFARARTKVFGVTGSDGKSTTASLAAQMLTRTGKATYLGGNIGEPLIAQFAENEAFGCTVAELSSFQLFPFSPPLERAVITNITENHLNWHRSFDEYREAKSNILRRAASFVLNADDESCVAVSRDRVPDVVFSCRLTYAALRKNYPESLVYSLESGHILRQGKFFCRMHDLAAREPYNVANALAAFALTDGYATPEAQIEAAAHFRKLPHRAEKVAEIGGVNFVDSSIDSTPTRTAATLSSLGGKVILLLGGAGKGLSVEPLIEPIRAKCKLVLFFGEGGKKIADTLYGKIGVPCAVFPTLEAAVAEAKESAESGDTVLLSPAATSFDAFRDYAERGEKFREYIGACK